MSIKRGEIWIVDLTTNSKADEINKDRRCVVVNDDDIGVLPLKMVVPLTKWKDRYEIAPWHIPIDVSPSNGLTLKSSADTFQVRSISEARFIKKVGYLTEGDLDRIKHGLCICLCIDEK